MGIMQAGRFAMLLKILIIHAFLILNKLFAVQISISKSGMRKTDEG